MRRGKVRAGCDNSPPPPFLPTPAPPLRGKTQVILKEISSLLSLNLSGGLSFSNGYSVLNIARELSLACEFGGMDDTQRPVCLFISVRLWSGIGMWCLTSTWTQLVLQTDFQPDILKSRFPSLCHFWIPSCRSLVSANELLFNDLFAS